MLGLDPWDCRRYEDGLYGNRRMVRGKSTMLAKAREVLVVVVLAALAAAGPLASPLRGQTVELISTETDELPAPTPREDTVPLPSPPSILQPPPPPHPPAPPPLFGPVDPGFDGWGPYGPPSAPPGLFFDLEVSFIHPVLRDRISNNFPLAPSGDTLTVPTAALPWTVAPWFEAGWRFRNGLGQVTLGYRFFDTQANAALPFSDFTPSPDRTRFVLNMVDLDYGTAPYSFAPGWWVKWRAGVRYADIFFDSSIQNATAFQQASNSFQGAGPHARTEIDRQLAGVPGLSLYGRVDGSVEVGRVNQNFRELLTNPDGTQVPGFFNQHSMQAVPVLMLQAGLHYTPPQMANVHFYGGWTFEHWWYVGQLGFESTSTANMSNFISPSRGEFGTQGIFVRGWVDF